VACSDSDIWYNSVSKELVLANPTKGNTVQKNVDTNSHMEWDFNFNISMVQDCMQLKLHTCDEYEFNNLNLNRILIYTKDEIQNGNF